jgi:hypothetical protein
MVYLHPLELSENCLKQRDEHDSDKKHAVSIFVTSKLCDYNFPFTLKYYIVDHMHLGSSVAKNIEGKQPIQYVGSKKYRRYYIVSLLSCFIIAKPG